MLFGGCDCKIGDCLPYYDWLLSKAYVFLGAAARLIHIDQAMEKLKRSLGD